MAKKTLYFDKLCGYTVSASTEDGKLVGFKFENDNDFSIVGNVYKGRIDRVLMGMQAAFIDCGLEKNCYLSIDDCFPDAEKYDGANADITLPELVEGQEVMVQVTRAPVGKKGARVSLFPSFVGTSIIYFPLTPFIGVSRKITDDELRKSLAFTAEKMIAPGEGVVLRTAAPFVKPERMKFELDSLRNVYRGVTEKFASAKTGELLFSDVGLMRRILRDMISYDIEEIFVGNEEIAKHIEEMFELSKSPRCPITVHNSMRDMFEEYGLTAQIAETINPRVDLENGAHLVIDRCEALTAIDVNTGKFTGDDSLEHTVYYTNILAAREIARQVRLRNIGGIIAVDFIDMASEAHNRAVVEELENALKKDRTKHCVAPMSRFGVVEFTRQRIETPSVAYLNSSCRHCGQGHVKSVEFILFNMRARLLTVYAEGYRCIIVDMNDGVLARLSEWKSLKDDLKARLKDAELYFVPHRTYADEQISYHFGDQLSYIPTKAVKLV